MLEKQKMLTMIEENPDALIDPRNTGPRIDRETDNEVAEMQAMRR